MTKSDYPNEIKKALSLGENAMEAKSIHEEGLLLIQEMLMETFEIVSPSGNKRLPSFLLFQAIKSLSEKITMPSFSLNSEGTDSDLKRIVTLGVEEVLRRGGFIDALESGFGAFERMLTFGDSLLRIGTNAETAFPVQYQVASLREVFINPEATAMRTGGSSKDVEEMLLVYEYKKKEFENIYGETDVLPGRLPIFESLEKDNEIIEVGYYYNRSEKIYTIFAGKNGVVLKNLKREDYPFVKNNEAYLPIMHLRCFAVPDSFYSRGIGHLVYRLGMIRQIMLNKGISEGLNNINPIRIINVPQGKKSSFLARLREAYEAQKRGLPGVVLNEIIPGENSYAELQKFSSDQLTTEWERIFNQIDLTLQRCGINLNRAHDPKKPLGVVEIEEERQNEFIKDIVSQNSSELRFAIEVAIDLTKKFITKNSPYSSVPIRVGEFKQPDGSIVAPRITLGMVADELRNKNYNVEINSRSGAVNSRILDRIRRERVLNRLNQESSAYKKLLIQDARDDGIELSENDL